MLARAVKTTRTALFSIFVRVNQIFCAGAEFRVLRNDSGLQRFYQRNFFTVVTSKSCFQFCDHAFAHVGLQWEDHVKFDPRYQRPTEVDALLGDASKAQARLDWRPPVTFAELVSLMVDSDIAELDAELSGRSAHIDP